MKKFLRTSLVLIIIIISGAMLFGCGKKPIQSITLSAPSDTYYVGDEFDISVTLTPDKASRDDLVWEVNNRLIASVNDGHVKTIGKGRLVVTAYYKKNRNIKDEIVINVIEKTDGLDLKDTAVTYNGQPQTPQYTSPAGVQVLFQYAPMGSSIFTDGLPVNAGSYRVRGYVNGNTSLVDTCNLVIQKKDLKIDVGDATISYSDNFDNVVEVSVDGLVAGESFRFGTKLQNTIPSSQLVVGTYPIVYKVTNSSGEEIELTNYNVIATNGTLTVVPKKVTVIPNGDFQVTYGRIPNLKYNVVDENNTNIDSQYLSQITGSLDYASQDGTSNKNDVGDKNITIGTLSSTNFDIEFDNTKTFEITKQLLRLYPQGKTVLPGTEITNFEYSATGLLAGDRIENPFMLKSNQIIKNDNIVIYDSSNRVVTFNYDISVQEGVEITEGITVNLNINPIEVDYNGTDYETANITTISSGSIKQNLTVSYINNDGQTVIVNTVNVNEENNYQNISFQISTGTTITVQLGFGTFTKPEKSTTIYATRKFDIVEGGENYTFNLNGDAGIIIKKIQSVISVVGGDISIEYGDELTNPSLTITNANVGESWELKANVKFYNKNGDEIKLDKFTPVGSYKIKPTYESEESESEDVDYSMYNVEINEANLFITAAPIDIVLNDENFQKEYGEDDPTFNYTITGLKNNEDYATVVAGQLVREAGENVGKYDINQGSLHVITNNYYINPNIDGEDKFEITQAPLTITLIDSSKIYGEDDPQLLYTVSGLKFGDTASTVITGQPTRSDGETVKKYDITGGSLSIVSDNKNYTLDSINNATFTINARPLTINIITKDILSEDDATPGNVEYSISQNGLVNNDQITITKFILESNNLQVKEVEYTIKNGENDVTSNYDVQLGTNKIAFNLVKTQAIININNIIIDYNQNGYTLNPTYQLVTNVTNLTVNNITYKYKTVKGEEIEAGDDGKYKIDAGTYYIDAVTVTLSDGIDAVTVTLSDGNDVVTVTLSDKNVSCTVSRGTLIINKINPSTTPVVDAIEYDNWTNESKLNNVSIIDPTNWSIAWKYEKESLQQGRHQYLATCTLIDENKEPNPNYNPVNIWITVIAREEINANNIQATLQWDNRVYTGQTYTQNQFASLSSGNTNYLQYLNVSYSYEYNGEKITNGFTNAGTYKTIGTISLKSTYNDLFVITGTTTDTPTIEQDFSIDKATATLVNTIPANGYKYTGESIVVWGSENDLYIKENISINKLTITIYDSDKTEPGVIVQEGNNWPSIYGTYYITIVLESDNYELNINLDKAIEYTINKQTLTITYNNLKDQYTYSNTLSLTKDNIGVTIEGNDGSIDTQTTFYNIIESVPEDIDTSSKKQLDELGNIILYKSNNGTDIYTYLSIKNVDESLSYYQICDNQTISNAGEYAVVTLASDQNYEGKAYKTFVINKASIGSIRLQSDYITVSRTTTNDELWQTLVNNILTTSIKSQPIYFVIISGSQKYYIRQNNDVVQVTDNNNQAVNNFLNFIKPKTNGNHTITLAIDSSQNYNELRHNFNFNTTKEDVSFEVNFNATNYFNGSYIVPHTVVFSGGYFGEQTKYAIDPAKLTVKGQTLTYVINLEDINEEITITFSSILMGTPTLPRNASPNNYTTTTTVTLENDTYFNLSNTQYSCTYSINRAKYNISASSTKIEVTYTGSQININELKPLVVKNNNNEIIDLTYNTTTNYVNIKVYYQKEGTTNKTEVAPTEVGTYYITFNISVKGGEENNVEIDSDISEVELTIAKYQLLASDILIAGNNIEYDANNGTINTIYSGGVEFKITKNSTSTAPISTDSTFVAKYNDNTQLPSAVGEYIIKISVLSNNNISDLLLKLNINANDISGSGKSVENKIYNYGNIITYNAADLSTNTLLTDDSIDITYYTTENELIKNITDAGTYKIHVKGKGNFTGEFTVNNVIVDKLDISEIELVQQTLTLTNIYGNDLLNNINGAIVENYQVNSENNNVNINGSFIFVKSGNNYVKASTDGVLSQGSGILSGITENLNTEIFKNNIGEKLLTCYFIAEDKNFKGTKKDMSFTYVVNPAPTEDKTVDYLAQISINEIISADEIRFNSINSNNKTLLINTDETSITAIFENEFNVYVINNTAYIALTSNYDSVNEVYKVVYDKEYTYSGDVVTGTTGNGYRYTWQEEDGNVLFIIEKTLNSTDETITLLGGKYRVSENYEYGNISIDIQFTPTAIDGSLIINPLSEGGSYQLGGKELSINNADYINIKPEHFVAMNNAKLLEPTVTFTYNSETYTLNTENNLNSVLDKNGNKIPLPAGDYDATLTVTLPNTIWYNPSQSVDFTLQATFNKIDLRWNPQSLQEITSISDVPTFIYEEAIGSEYYVTYYLVQKSNDEEATQTSTKLFTITYNGGIASSINIDDLSTLSGGLYSYSITDSKGVDKLNSEYNNNTGYFVLYKPDMFNQDSSVVYGELLSISDIMKNNSPLSLFAYEVGNVNLNDVIDVNFFNNNYLDVDVKDNVITAFYLPIDIITTYREYSSSGSETIYKDYSFSGSATIKVNLSQGYKIVPIVDTTSKVYDGKVLTVKANVYSRNAIMIEGSEEEGNDIQEKLELIEEEILTKNTSGTDAGEYKVEFTYLNYTQSIYAQIIKATPKFTIDNDSLIQVYNGLAHNVSVNVYGINKNTLPSIQIKYKKKDASDDLYLTDAPTNAGEYDVKIVHNSKNYYGEYYTVLTVNKAMATVTVVGTTFEYSGINQTPIITVKGLNNSTLTSESDYKVVYNNDKESINAGSYTAVLNMLDGSNYTYQENYTINYAIKPKQVSDLTLDSIVYTYNGNEQIPTVMNGDVEVIEDDNITIQRPQNSIDAGSYSITITGQNNYVGKAVLNYVIRPSELDITVDSTQTFVYDGSVQRPTYIVQDHNGIDVANTYYEVVQSDSKDAGSYKITISSSSNNYVGEYIIEYVIKPYQAQIEVSGLNKVYGKDGEPSITVKGVGGEILTPADYSITYNDGATVPTDAGEYLVEVVMTNNNYVGTFVGNYTIQKAKANISITNLEQDYTGSAINPTITVTDSKGTQLLTGEDYTITYKKEEGMISENNVIDAGEYTVEVELSNPNYYGYAIATFVINRLIADIDIATENFVYDGTVHDLEYQVKYNGEQVKEQSNSIVTITGQSSQLQNAGVYEISIFVLTDNYQAQVTKYIEIYKKEATIEVTNLEVEYNGTQQSPTIFIYDGDSLLGDISYNTTYKGPSDSPNEVGVYDIVITINNNNYYGTYSGKFVISKATPTITWNTGTEFTYGSVNVSVATIDANGASVTYYVNGQVKTIEDINNLSAGTYVITAQFAGNENYNAVSISKTIIIKKLDISDQITIENLTQQYDGTDKKPTISVQNNLEYEVTYNGSSTLQNAVGTYEVIVRVNTDNYIGLKVAVFKIVSQESELTWDTNTVFEYGSVNITELAGASYTINDVAGDLSSIVDVGDYTVVAKVGDKSVIKIITVIPQKKDITISYSKETNDFSAVFDGTDITVELKYYNGETELTQEQISNKEWDEVLTIIAEVEYGTGNYYGYAQSTFTTATSNIEEVTIDNLSGVNSIIENNYTSTVNTISYDSNYSVTVVEGNSGIEILEDKINISKAGRYLVKYSLVDNNNAYKYQYIVINKIDPNFEWTVSQYEYNKGDSVSLNGATTNGGTISYQVDDSNTFGNIDGLNAYINDNPADSYKITAILNGGDNYYSKTISYYITFKSISASATITNNTFEVGATINLGLIVTSTDATYTTTYYNSNGEEITLSNNLQAGKYYAVVEFTGNYVGSYRFDFVVNKKITSINWASQQFVYNGQDHSQAIKNASIDGVSDDEIKYTINNEDNWIYVGNYTATAKFAGNDEYEACEVTLTFTIIPAEVEYEIDSQTSIFDNQAKMPIVNVYGVNDTLLSDTYYTIKYYKGDDESEIKNAGEYEIRVTIINSNYCGSQSFSYVVQKAQATITITDLNTDYNGQSQSPKISVIDIAGNKLNNYNVTYDELKTQPLNADSYKVKVIVDDDNYYGEKQAIFVINKIEASIEVDASELEKTYNGTSQKPNISVVGYNGEALQPNEYSIVYKKNNEVDQDLTNAGTYQIYVEVDNSTNYFGSAQFEYTIHRAKANITVSDYVTTYSGQSQTPTITVTDSKGKQLDESNYTVAYKENGEAIDKKDIINAGKYTVEVTLLTNSNYYGKESFDFVIQQAQAHFTVTNLVQTYVGTDIKPNITVTGINGTSLQPGDYNVTYNKETTLPQNVGEYAVAITINNSNYYGYYNDTFVIQKAKVSINVEGNDTFEYDGNTHKLIFSIGTLSESDYVVKYYNSSGNEVENINNITNVGVYKAVVEIINNNYSGEYIHYMNITPKDIAGITLSIAGSELSNNTSLALTYNGSSYEFSYYNISKQEISYEYQYAELGSATDTPVSEMTIQQAGRYNIILTGTGNYKGQIRFFIVVNKQDNPYSISKTTYVYSGEDYIDTIKASITPRSSDIKVYNYYDLNNEVNEVTNAGTYLVRVYNNNIVPYEFVVSVHKVNIFGLKQTGSSELPDNEGKLSIDDGLNDKYDEVLSLSGNIFQYTFNAYKEGSPHLIDLTISVIKNGNQNYTYRVLYVYNGKMMTYDYVGATTEQDISISITSDGEIVRGQSSDAYLNCPLTFSYKEGSSSSSIDNKEFNAYIMLDDGDTMFSPDEMLSVHVVDSTFILRYIKTISETKYITSIYTQVSASTNVYEFKYFDSGKETTDEETGTTNPITEQKLLNSTIITVTYGTNKITIEGDNFIIEL